MGPKTILIVDDEPLMRRLLKDFLKKENYTVVEAADGKEALALFSEQPSLDLLILDIMMPTFDGWFVCREIRKSSKVPIMILTARSSDSDELFGFELGADEYITKPFNPEILVARVNALFRRLHKDGGTILSFEGLTINKSGHTVSLYDAPLELSPKEYDLLLYLVEHRGRALSRDQILDRVWSYEYYGDSRTVDTTIKRLRTKLGEFSPWIQTVRGFGYRFEVEK